MRPTQEFAPCTCTGYPHARHCTYRMSLAAAAPDPALEEIDAKADAWRAREEARRDQGEPSMPEASPDHDHHVQEMLFDAGRGEMP